MMTTHSYDTAGRLESIASQRPGPAQPVSAVGYEFDAAGRRNRQLMADGTAWHYDYNDRGEVTGASRKWTDGSAVAGQQFAQIRCHWQSDERNGQRSDRGLHTQ